jgi:hypothetical protein
LLYRWDKRAGKKLLCDIDRFELYSAQGITSLNLVFTTGTLTVTNNSEAPITLIISAIR